MRTDLVNLRKAPVFCKGCWFFLACLLFGLTGISAAEKTIRLRNETIVTPEKVSARLQAQAVESPVTGLYLVQFEGPFQAEWKDLLAVAHGTLIRPVPEDAFVVKLAG